MCVVKIIEEKFGLNRNDLFEELSKKGIGLGVHYTPLHYLTLYRETLHYKTGEFPIAERLYKEVLSLPIFPTITRGQMNYVIEEMKNACGTKIAPEERI